jgi:uncharacterized Zn-binding protein involved in type VI secretion
MRRNMILKGDKTTRDGVVIEGDETMTNDGRPLAYQGCRVYCPACKTTGFIANVPPYLPMTFCGGKQVALEGDLCLCACDPKPKLLASRDDMFMTLEAHELARMGYAPNGARLPPEQQPKYIAFKTSDAGSLYGLRCVAHFDDGSTASGYFDHENTVRFNNPPGTACRRLSLAADGNAGGTFCSAFVGTLTV